MNRRPFVITVIAVLIVALAGSLFLTTRDQPAASPEAAAAALPPEVQKVIQAMREKIAGGATRASDFVSEFAALDAYIAARGPEAPEDTADLHLLRAGLYFEAANEPEKAVELLAALQRELPNTEAGRAVPELIARLEPMVESHRIQKNLVVGAPFPDFEESAISGQPLSVSKYRGKVVLVDFWAMWCSSCQAQLPGVIAAYRKFHDRGFDIIGISLDGPDQKQALAKFAEQRGMPWEQYYDGGMWETKLARKYGIMAIPATFVLDRQGRIAARDVHGPELEAAIERALAAP